MENTYAVIAIVLFSLFSLLMFVVPIIVVVALVKWAARRAAAKQGNEPSVQAKVPPNGKGLITTGMIFICIGVLLFAMCLPAAMFDRNGDTALMGIALFLLVFFDLPGLAVAIAGGRQQKFYTKYARYTTMVAAPGEYSLDELAASYPAMYDRACADLQALIHGGYIPNAYLDLQARKLVRLPAGPQAVPAEKPPASPEEVKQAVINCPNCGSANAVTEGKITGCEYCGSPLTV